MNQKYNYSRDYFGKLYNRLPVRKKNPNLIKYAETTVIPSGPYRGQKFKHSVAPYLKRPLELLSPESNIKEVVMMFPAQTGKSTTAELSVMYYITKVPSEIIYATSNETAAIKWMERRIEPRAVEAGIIFRSELESKTSRKTGNTSYSKLFPGGNIDIASALSPAQLAQETKRFAIGDEVDRWKLVLGEEGSTLDQLRARTQAWGSLSKILWISTPTTEDVSIINMLFMMGDQCYFFVPCPYCGTMQLLDFYAGRGHGLTWEYKYGKILKKSISLICESKTCQREIREPLKRKMLNGGEWRQSAIPEFDFMASFNINGIYSPFLSWYEMAISFDKAQKDPIQKQAHENLKMGHPFREIGTRPKVKRVMENIGKYKSGTVPDGVLYITAGIDVQEGSESNENNPARLEMEILGIGLGYKTWSIEYKVFKGPIIDPHSGAWEKLNEYAKEHFIYYRSDGFGFPVQLVFIDSSSGKMSDIVYSFCDTWTNAFPIKGRSEIRAGKKDASRGDEIIQGNLLPYRFSKLDEDIGIYLINTNYYKSQLYHNLKIKRQEIEPQRARFCDFPADYDEKYFHGLTAEDRYSDGSFHNKTGRRNEPLDCRVYAQCAGDVWLYNEVLNYRAWAKSEKWTPSQIQEIGKKYVLEIIAKKTKRRKIKIKLTN